MNDPKRCPPALAAYFEAVLTPFVEGCNAPRPFFEARLAALDVGAAELEKTLETLDAPLLVAVAGVEHLVGSAEEAPRTGSVVSDQVHVVRGAARATAAARWTNNATPGRSCPTGGASPPQSLPRRDKLDRTVRTTDGSSDHDDAARPAADRTRRVYWAHH